jgi:hypothetical protein
VEWISNAIDRFFDWMLDLLYGGDDEQDRQRGPPK